MIELSFNLQPSLRQILTVMLNPRMMQMLNILHMPYIDLVKEIEKAAEENVMIEVEKRDELIEYIKSASKEGHVKRELLMEELPDIDSLPDHKMTLFDYLLNQLGLEYLNEKEKKIGEFLIKSIDKNGFITDYPEIKQTIEKKLKVSSFLIEKVLKIIQGFEPEGVGARNIKECLIIQVRAHNFENEELQQILETVISKYLDDLAKKNFKKIAGKLAIEEQGVEYISEFIKKNLNPYPGSSFSKKSAPIIPSYAIKEEEGNFVAVNLEKTYGPSVKISPQYLNMLEDPKTDKKTMEFLRTKFESAKYLLESLHKRQETSQKIIDLVAQTQKRFFEGGPVWLNPLMQKDIAKKLDVHPSTISRAIADKYVETPRGVFSLKFLCPRALKGATGEKIRSLIKKLVEKEDKSNPLSDDDIKNILQSENSIKIERRTITAYRKDMEIPSSFERKNKND